MLTKCFWNVDLCRFFVDFLMGSYLQYEHPEMPINVEVIQAAWDDGAAESGKTEECQDPSIPVERALDRSPDLNLTLRASTGNCGGVEIQ